MERVLQGKCARPRRSLPGEDSEGEDSEESNTDATQSITGALADNTSTESATLCGLLASAAHNTKQDKGNLVSDVFRKKLNNDATVTTSWEDAVEAIGSDWWETKNKRVGVVTTKMDAKTIEITSYVDTKTAVVTSAISTKGDAVIAAIPVEIMRM